MLYHVHVYSVNDMFETDIEEETEEKAKEMALSQSKFPGQILKKADCSKIALAFSKSISNYQYHDKAFYQCQCHSEVLNVERNIEILNYKDKAWDVNIYFAMYHYGTQNHRPTLREKLRHCWRILKIGKNYADDIILSVEDAREMGKDLLKMCDETEIKTEAKKMLSSRKETSNDQIKSTSDKK